MKTTARYSSVAILPAILFACLILIGCGGEKKTPPVPVGQMEEYRDPVNLFHIEHPQGWTVNAEAGRRASFFNAPEVQGKFIEPTGNDPAGVMISVFVNKISNPDSARQGIVAEMKQSGMQVEGESQETVAGKTAYRVPFKANYGPNALMTGHHIFIPSDSVLYDLQFAGFGDLYDAYKNIFEASLKTFQIPEAAAAKPEETVPSDVYESGDTKFFTYQYPDNFIFTNPPRGSFELAVELQAEKRRDCSIRFDVFDAKGLTVDKVFDQNKGRYRAKGTGRATIGGEQALFVNYSPARDVESRAYFAVHNGKVLRVTLNWYKPLEKAYLAAYEKVIGSVRFKG